MTILMKFPVAERESPDDPNALALEAFALIGDAYDAAISDDDIVLSRIGPTLESRAAELLDFHDGAVEPERIVSLAEDWNKCIERHLDAVLARMQAAAGFRPDGTRAWLDCPPSDIYALKKAAMALDGHVYAFAERALLVDEHRYLTTILRPEELLEIKSSPVDYVVLEVCPK